MGAACRGGRLRRAGGRQRRRVAVGPHERVVLAQGGRRRCGDGDVALRVRGVAQLVVQAPREAGRARLAVRILFLRLRIAMLMG